MSFDEPCERSGVYGCLDIVQASSAYIVGIVSSACLGVKRIHYTQYYLELPLVCYSSDSMP